MADMDDVFDDQMDEQEAELLDGVAERGDQDMMYQEEGGI
jgi:hypothetical protein